MSKCSLVQEKLTVTGPRNEIDSLMAYLNNELQNIHVVKSSPHFPFWKSIEDLYLVVNGEELSEVVKKIRRRLGSGSIYRGWIDFSQTSYPMCAANVT